MEENLHGEAAETHQRFPLTSTIAHFHPPPFFFSTKSGLQAFQGKSRDVTLTPSAVLIKKKKKKKNVDADAVREMGNRE